VEIIKGRNGTKRKVMNTDIKKKKDQAEKNTKKKQSDKGR
jgi:hypothetical protein